MKSVISQRALQSIQQKLRVVSKVEGAFVEENGPSWVEWKGESKKDGLGEISLPATKVDVISAFKGILENNRALSKPAILQLDRKIRLGREVGKAFVEEHGPSWVEWRGEHRKGDIGNVVLPATKADVQRVFKKVRPK